MKKWILLIIVYMIMYIIKDFIPNNWHFIIGYITGVICTTICYYYMDKN